MSPRVVVTGARGQLGAELCRQFGAGAVGLDLPEFDIGNGDRVAETVKEIAPGAVINAAAYTQVDKAEVEADRCRAVNSTGVGHLTEACRRAGAVLVQISTDYVFGGDLARSTPYRESDPPSPQSIYAQSKLDGEEQARQWKKHFVVRTCGLYGHPGPRSAGNFVETMLRLGQSHEKLRIVADQHCTPSYVRHVARAILFLLSTDCFGTYHVVNSGETTWYEFAGEIFRLAGYQIDLEAISTAQYGAAADRPRYSVLDTAKYLDLPGRPAMPHWREALAEYLRERG
jgi:dTDP-4-dehydrorhamnose reductase